MYLFANCELVTSACVGLAFFKKKEDGALGTVELHHLAYQVISSHFV